MSEALNFFGCDKAATGYSSWALVASQVLTDLWSLQNLPEMVVVVLNNSRLGVVHVASTCSTLAVGSLDLRQFEQISAPAPPSLFPFLTFSVCPCFPLSHFPRAGEGKGREAKERGGEGGRQQRKTKK